MLLGPAALALTALLTVLSPAQAAVTHKLTSSFNEGGTLSQPGPIAVDTSTHSVYVVTGGSTFAGDKVEKFDASGNPANFSFLGTNSFKACQFFGCIRGIAVDNSDGVNHGVIYVATSEHYVLVYMPSGQFAAAYHFSHVLRDNPGGNEGTYCGIAVDGSGSIYIQHPNGFFEDGAYTDKFQPGRWRVNASPPQIWPVAGIFQQPQDSGSCKVGADANQFLYTARGEYTGTGTLKRWPMSAVELVSPPSKVIDTGVSAFYADQSNGDLYSDEVTQVSRFNSLGEPVELFGDGDLGSSSGIAVDSENGTVYVSDRTANDVKVYSAVTTPDVTNIGATTGQHAATVSAHIDPAGAGSVTSCEVEYGLDKTYGSTAPCSGTFPSATATDITASIPGLAVETEYHYRVRAANANGTTRSIDRTFMTHAVADVQALAPTDITRTSATLNGSFTGNGEPTTYHFEWGTDTSYGNSTPESAPTSAAGTVPASAGLTELEVYLEDSPPYHFRLVATNGAGTTYGPDMTFHTLPPNLPAIGNESASGVTPTSVVLGAEINPGLGDTSYLFEYGPTPSYGENTVPSQSIGNDDVPHPVSSELLELTPGVTYHYRVVATNFGGTSQGTDQTFETPDAPTIGATSASGLTTTAATLEARIQPGFRATTYHFEYGTGTSYGTSTAETPLGGVDNVEHGASVAIGGLSPGTTYHFRVVATNAIGTAVGPDETLATSPAPVPPPPPAARPRRCKRGFVRRHGKCVRKKHRRHRHRRHHRTTRANG
jgi:hypothetical protein